ncbi:DUF805 domain-containing protein [Alistipes sp. An66]|uniref:DUF805 domain-containing protein n=1 Tax=Alistipes sp. An66 TaxID=1965650 RepID=UPI000B38A8A3|nr:DUF805 domain-containing protein [Alistipes sp. An66]OUN58263.1 hypothetical protein B5G16_09295 [Alistipes sp. An66]
MKWFFKCIRNYVNFSGRARRTEFWYFILFSCLLLIVAMALDVVCFNTPYGVFYLLVALFLFLPQLAVSARRLHDTGRTSKWLLWNYLALLVWAVAALVLSGLSAFAGGRDASAWFLIVLCGGCVLFFIWEIVFLVWFCLPGTPGENRYGPDPKQPDQEKSAPESV